MLRYTTTFLRSLGKPNKNNVNLYHLNRAVRTWAIAIGIRKRPNPYRRSKAGQKLFHRIHSIFNRGLWNNNNNKVQIRPAGLYLVPVNITTNTTRLFCISHINARSIHNKIESFQEHLLARRVDICAVTETWLKQADINSMAHREVPPEGYSIISHSRLNDRPGGGVAIVYRDNVRVKDHTGTNLFSTMEYMNASICLNISTINLYIIYRYLASSVIDFCNELVSLLEENVNTDKGTLILTGDFNIHMDDPTHPDTNTFIDTLDGLDLRNHVNFPTHKLNHHLDLFIDTTSSPILTEVECGFMLSDHNFVHALIELTKPRAPKQEVTYRKLKNIDHSKMDQDLSVIVQHSACLHNSSLEELVSFYNDNLMKVINQHAPCKTKLLTVSHSQPWFDAKIKAEIILRRDTRNKPLDKIPQNTTTGPFTTKEDTLQTLLRQPRNSTTTM